MRKLRCSNLKKSTQDPDNWISELELTRVRLKKMSPNLKGENESESEDEEEVALFAKAFKGICCKCRNFGHKVAASGTDLKIVNGIPIKTRILMEEIIV